MWHGSTGSRYQPGTGSNVYHEPSADWLAFVKREEIIIIMPHPRTKQKDVTAVVSWKNHPVAALYQYVFGWGSCLTLERVTSCADNFLVYFSNNTEEYTMQYTNRKSLE